MFDVSRHDSTEDDKLGRTKGLEGREEGKLDSKEKLRGNQKNVAEGEGPPATMRLFAAPAPVGAGFKPD